MKTIEILFEDGTVNYEMKSNAINHIENNYPIKNVKWTGWDGLSHTDVTFKVQVDFFEKIQRIESAYLRDELGVFLEEV